VVVLKVKEWMDIGMISCSGESDKNERTHDKQYVKIVVSVPRHA